MLMTDRTDQEWIRQLKQEDPEAIEDLWMLLYTLAAKLSGQRCWDDAMTQEALAQEAALQAYQRITKRGIYQFRFESSFRSFCWRIIGNEIWRLLKKQAQPYAELDEEAIPQSCTHTLTNPDAIWEKLRPCLDHLSAREREVIDLLYGQEHPPEKVAESLAISRNYVNVLAHRARQQMRDCLQAHGYQTADDLL